MKAVGLIQYLPIENENSLLDIEIPKPTAKGKDLLVKVKAISVNPVDTKVRAPKDKVESEPKILGWDAAGVVVEVGDEVTEFQPGDEVIYAGDITRPGSNSEFQLIDERIVGRKPQNLDFARAAAYPRNEVETSYLQNVLDRISSSVNLTIFVRSFSIKNIRIRFLLNCTFGHKIATLKQI